jgi:hypothetical protein
MPLLDLVCIGCWEVVFGATELGFEDAVGKERLLYLEEGWGLEVMVADTAGHNRDCIGTSEVDYLR